MTSESVKEPNVLVQWYRTCLWAFIVVLTGYRLYITVDDQIVDLYIDGQQYTNLPNGNTWNVPDLITLPAAPSLIAVSAHNLAFYAGVLASDSDGRITDSTSWKCSYNLEAGWTQPGFDDSGWLPAWQTFVNGDKNSGVAFFNGGNPIWNIRPQAYWLWAQPANTPDWFSTVYCRGHLAPKGNSYYLPNFC